MRLICMTALLLLTIPLAAAQEAGAKPSPEHKLLAQDVGERSGTMKLWMQGPDAEPVDIPFKEVNTSILGGLWMQTEFESGPYKGHGMIGYDPKKKKYVGTWTNNMAPNLVLMEGTYDEFAQEITMTFKDYDQATGKLTDHKTVRTVDPSKPETMTMYKKSDNGKWIKTFVLEYPPQEK